jgi:Tfp pilus assembly protein PilP
VALFGIVIDGDELHAIVRTGPAAPVMHVRVGDDIGGWKVAQIEERRLILVLDDRIATFTMFAGYKANGAPQGGAVAPPPAETNSQDQTQPRNQTQPQNQTPQRESTPPHHRRHGSVTLEKYSLVK